MVAAIDADPRRKLGSRFWIGYTAAIVLIAAAFAAGVFYIISVGFTAWAMAALVIAYTVSIWALGMLPWYIRRKRGVESALRTPMKRYLRRFMPAMIIYVVLLEFGAQYYNESKPEGWIVWALALAPVAPLLYAIRAMGLLYKEQDDQFEREKMAFAFVWSTCVTMAVCVTWGLLETFQLVPHLWMWVLFPFWAVCFGIAQGIATWRYR